MEQLVQPAIHCVSVVTGLYQLIACCTQTIVKFVLMVILIQLVFCHESLITVVFLVTLLVLAVQGLVLISAVLVSRMRLFNPIKLVNAAKDEQDLLLCVQETISQQVYQLTLAMLPVLYFLSL